METNKGNGFIGYEYMEVAADRQMEAVYADSYPSFGWRLRSEEHTSELQSR